VARFVEDEVEHAKESWLREAVPLAGLQCPACQKPIDDDDLRKKRREEELLSVLKDVPPEDLEKLVEQSRS
jgi:hypothetical protein